MKWCRGRRSSIWKLSRKAWGRNARGEALRQAREVIKARYPNPFYWAVFVLHGEG